MGSLVSPQHIYAYCLEHKNPMVYIGRNNQGKPVLQCRKCKIKRIVPEEWVRGLEPAGDFGMTKEEEFQKNKEKKLMETYQKKVPLEKNAVTGRRAGR